jgi:hypothetical protein
MWDDDGEGPYTREDIENGLLSMLFVAGLITTCLGLAELLEYVFN